MSHITRREFVTAAALTPLVGRAVEHLLPTLGEGHPDLVEARRLLGSWSVPRPPPFIVLPPEVSHPPRRRRLVH